MDAIIALLRYSTPVGLSALGEAVGQRTGLINIGLEGMMLAAAYAATVSAIETQSVLIGCATGVLVAVLIAAVQALFTVTLARDQVVVGTGVNLFCLGLTSTLYRRRFGGSGQLVETPDFLTFGPGFDVVMLLFLALMVAAGWWLYRSKWGLMARGSGEYPAAVDAAGFDVRRIRWTAALIAGAAAGLGGAYLALGVAGSFAENMTAGRGFLAIALVTFGRWKPVWIVLASLLVVAVNAIQFQLQARGVQVPTELFVASPYILALLVLVIVGKGTTTPASLGVPYQRKS